MSGSRALLRQLQLRWIPGRVRGLATLPVLLFAVLASSARAEAPLDTEHDRILFALGLRCANELRDFALDDSEIDLVERGIRAALLGGEIPINANAYPRKIKALRGQRHPAAVARERELARGYVERASREAGAVRSDSGVLLFTLLQGTGPSPTDGDTIRVHFHGKLRDGTVFDSSVDRGEARQMKLGRMFPCWREGVKTMKGGGRSRLVCPPDTAWGDAGTPRVPGGAALDIEIQLIAITK